MLDALRLAVTASHGVAIGPYLKHLIGLAEKLPSVIEKHMQAFLEHVRVSSSDGASRHAARNFALIYAGGCLAIDAGVLPFTRQELLDAILVCFHDGYDLLTRAVSVSTKAREIMSTRLRETEKASRLRRDAKPCGAFIRRTEAGEQLVMRSTEVRGWFPSPRHLNSALDWLERQKRLVLAHSRSSKPRGTGYEWAVSSPRWLDNSKQKSIVVRLK